MKVSLVVGALCTLLLSSFNVGANVTVTVAEKTYVFPDKTRLDAILQQVPKGGDWYWPAAQLFSESSSQMRLHEEVIELLSEHGATKIDFKVLQKQVQQWTIAKREKIDIDPDLAAISFSHRPALPSGNYWLQVAERPQYIEVLGAVESPIKLPYTSGACLKDQLESVKRTPFANNSVVTVIEPSGNIITGPMAYWNHECKIVMPGSLIYVPIEPSLFGNEEEINQMITQLLLNRVK